MMLSRFILLFLLCVGTSLAENGFDLPLGPIGGTGRSTSGQNYLRVTSVTTAAPGALAGLQVNDFIRGAFGEEFSANTSGANGPEQDLGLAIERAESGDGQLPLKVLRTGVGDITLNVALTPAGAFGPAYPLNSAKYSGVYSQACARLHQRVQSNGSGNLGFLTGSIGLSLLGNSHWNETNGPTPYRTSINWIRDFSVSMLTNAVYAPVEDILFDGTANPNYVANPTGLESWTLGSCAMFLAEYYQKTGDTSVTNTIQRATEMLANRIQWWKQPDLGTGYSPSGPEIAGMVSHGGVTGDYIHIGWGGGINIVGVHIFGGLALGMRAGADMTARPQDGHYFGYADPPSNAVPAGMEYYDYTLDEKFAMQWEWMAGRCGGYSLGDFEDGHVCYTLQGWSSYDAAGRTAGTFFGMLTYNDRAALNATDADRINREEGYLTRNYLRLQDCHAYTHGGQTFYQLALPYFSDRNQRYVMDNWRFFYNLARQPDGTLDYVPGPVADNYLDYDLCIQIYCAMPGSIAGGGLPDVPAYNTNRIFANIKSPFLKWPTLDAKYARLTNSVQNIQADITDGLGNVLNAGSFTAQWSFLSGPATATFGTPASPNTTVTFPVSGQYTVQLTATSGAYNVTEPIQFDVYLASPTNTTPGKIQYSIYTGLTGTTIPALTNSVKYPNSPDIIGTLTSFDATYRGDNYGQRIRGYVIPPSTGTYTFYIESDDNSILKFNSAGTNAAAATVIASVTGSTSQYQWTKYASQKSANFTLTAGQPYYIEALQKEGTGADHVAVAWTVPGNTNITVIPGTALAMPTGTTILKQPVSQTATLGTNITFNVSVEGPGPILYQWRLNGIAYWSPSGDSALALANVGGGMAGNYDCLITSPSGVLTSAVATLFITDAGAITNGGLWAEYYNNISGSTVADLTGNSKFPRFSDASGVITNAEAPSEYADNYGQRWTGWLIPTNSASYRFNVAPDDAAEIWLSTDATVAHKTKIASRTTWVSSRAWTSVTPSAYIALTAGQRYYIEVLHKEGGGGDNLAVLWQQQGTANPTNGAEPIAGTFLQYQAGGIYGDSVPQPPLTSNDTVTAIAGLPVNIDVVANDLDADLATLTVTGVTAPAQGTANITGQRTVGYTATAGYVGSDQFNYIVRNSQNLTATGTVFLTVTNPDAALQSWWKFDEGTGATALDSWGTNNATIVGATWTNGTQAGALSFNGTGNYLSVPASAGSQLNNEITIALWAYGNAAILPAANSVIYATDASGNRILNIHFPWTDSNIYWDAGNSTGYDRINKAATAAQYEGQWNYWVFTKNATTGVMEIYINGVLWHSGTGLTRAFTSPITTLRIGSAIGSNYYPGMLDDIRLYNRALTGSEIEQLYTSVIGQENQAPSFSSNPIVKPTGTVGLAYSGTIAADAYDPNPGDALTFTKTTGPTWLNVAPTGALTGNPGQSAIGTNTFTVRATDPGDLYAQATLQIIIAANAAPTFTSNPILKPAASTGTPYSDTLSANATDPNPGDILTFAKDSGPAWLAIAGTGALTGTPALSNAGTNIFNVRVTDSAGNAATATMQIYVNGPIIAGSTNALVTETCTPTNGFIDVGETVTVNFGLKNTGTVPASNIVATLQSSPGVFSPSGPQTYGILATNGATVTRPFTFAAMGVCGNTFTAVLQVAESAVNISTVTNIFPLGSTGVSFTQNFDTVTAPALPTGWTTTGATNWITTTAQRDSLPNSAFNRGLATVGTNALISPAIPVTSSSAVLVFRNRYNLQVSTSTARDGGVLEIKIATGAWTDILTAGGSFTTGGYTHTISTSRSNPLGGRRAWSGNSGGFITTTATLPASAAGKSIQLRWLLGTDSSTQSTGWWVDSITITDRVCGACASADLALIQTASPDPVSVGSNLTYTINVANFGPSAATSVTVTDTLPANIIFQSATGGGTTNASGQVIWSLGTLNVNSNATLTILATATTPGIATNTAVAGSAITDPDNTDNTAVITNVITAPPPVADFNADPLTGIAPLLVTFTDTSTGLITNRTWSFGDTGTLDTTATNLTHNYITPGTNTVQLILTGPGGSATNTAWNLIIIKPWDTDGDSIPDSWETAHGLDPNSATDAVTDNDGDGFTNYQEYLAGTVPTDSVSALRITNVAIVGPDIWITFTSVTNKFYEVLRSVSPAFTSPATVTNNVPGTDHLVQISDPGAALLSSNFFYRIRLNP